MIAPEPESFVQGKVSTGRYTSAREVVREALCEPMRATLSSSAPKLAVGWRHSTAAKPSMV